MTSPTVGTLLGGKFVIEGVLGRGGMGVVYAARHTELDQQVAIKCLLPEAIAIPGMIERFSREARAAAKIQGEHVARVLDVGRFDDGTPYIVMEYLKGHDLAAELAARGPLPRTDAVRYVLEACEALAQAHAARIIHRDLKPSNLFLAEVPGRRPIVKVLDFGISKLVDAADALTRTSSLLGTPFYMSPEQLLSSKAVDERSDIWALGVILYELLAGEPPFTGETGPQIVAQIVQNTPAAPHARRPDISAELGAVILRCLRSRASERYASVAQLALALLPFADPADRGSAAAIARVLGIPDSVLAADVDPTAPTQTNPTAQQPSIGAVAARSDFPEGMQPPSAHLTPAVAATLGTGSSVALSTPPSARPASAVRWGLVLAGAVGLVAAGGAALLLRGAAASSSHGTGRGSAASPAPPVPVAPPAVGLAPTETGSAQAEPSPSPGPTGSSVAAVPPSPSVAPPGPPVSPRPGAPTTATVRAPTPAVSAPAPSANPAPHNPLDLQIK